MREVGYKPTKWRIRIREDVVALLRFIHGVFTQAGIPYFIINGTLLGAEKTQDVLGWDDDGDLGILLQDAERARVALANALKDNTAGFKMSDMLYGFGLYSKGHGIVDVIVFDVAPATRNSPDPVYISCYPLVRGKPTFLNDKILKLHLPTSSLFPLRRYKFRDMLLFGPAKGRELCLQKYGADAYTRNRRPEGNMGIHPLVPYVLPTITRVVQGVLNLTAPLYQRK